MHRSGATQGKSKADKVRQNGTDLHRESGGLREKKCKDEQCNSDSI